MLLQSSRLSDAQPATQITNPDCRITFEEDRDAEFFLANMLSLMKASQRATHHRFIAYVLGAEPDRSHGGNFIQTCRQATYHGGMNDDNALGKWAWDAYAMAQAHRIQDHAWEARSWAARIAITQMRNIARHCIAAKYSKRTLHGCAFRQGATFASIWCFVRLSRISRLAVRQIDQKTR